MSVNQSYVWYVGYGSNLCEERFLCYICGGQFKWRGSCAEGCTDKSIPTSNKPVRIPYILYFAKSSRNWNNGGVAFINPNKETVDGNWTLGRMWKITCEQYEEVRKQEGKSWYNHEIYLGEEDGIPIRTITNEGILTPCNQPSVGYLKTIALGLKETYGMIKNAIVEYLTEKDGIRGNYTEEQLKKIIESATSSNSG